MIEQHGIARAFGEQLGLPEAVLERSRPRTSNGTARAGQASAPARRCRWRPDRASGRVSSRSPTVSAGSGRQGVARERAGKQFDPRWPTRSASDGEIRSSRGSTRCDTWQAVIAAEPSLTLVLSGERFRRCARRDRDFVDLSRPTSSGHAAAVAELAAGAGRAAWARRTTRSRTLRRAGLVHDFGRSRRVERDLGQAPAAGRRRVGARPLPPVSDRADARDSQRRSRRSARSPSAPRAARRARAIPVG